MVIYIALSLKICRPFSVVMRSTLLPMLGIQAQSHPCRRMAQLCLTLCGLLAGVGAIAPSVSSAPSHSTTAPHVQDEASPLVPLDMALSTIPDKPAGVQWDGAAEHFVYTDAELQNAVNAIATAFITHPQNTAQQILALSPQAQAKFRRNQNTSAPWTRTEPFDLIQGEITRQIQVQQGDEIRAYGGNRIVITEMVHRVLHHLLQLSPDQDQRGADFEAFSVLQSDAKDGVLLLCADVKPFQPGEAIALGPLRRSSITPFFKAIPVSFNELQWLSPNPSLACNGENYTVRTEGSSQLSPPAAYPSTLFGDDRPLKALVNFGIVDYVEPERVQQIIFFMKALGYTLQEQTTVETLPFFTRTIVESDVFIPVAHRLDVNFFRLGQRDSHLLTFTKTVTNRAGQSVPIQLSALFPRKGKTVKLKHQDGFERLLSQRRETHGHSMVIINASCQSEVNILPWMRLYEQSLKYDRKLGKLKYLSDARDMPHIFASTQSFPTSSLANMATNFYHPLNAVEVLAEGGTPHDVLTSLRSPPPEDWLGGLLTFWDQLSDKGKRSYTRRGFDPVYNLSSQSHQRFHLPSQKVLVKRQGMDGTQWLEY